MTKWLRVLVSALMVLTTAVVAAPAAPVAAAPIGTISGQTLDGTGAVAPYTTVTLTLSDGTFVAGTVSDDTGTFTFSNVEEGSYALKFVASGWALTPYPAAVEITSMAPTVTGLVLQLAAPSTISGRVTGADGSPRANVYVYAGATVPSWYAYAAYTDADGYYTLTDVSPVSYKIWASVSMSSTWYHPAAGSIDDATPVTVTPGSALTGIDITAPPGRISGTIRVGTTPLAGAVVRAYAQCGAPYGNAEAVTAADGTYSLVGLANNCYRVEVSAAGYAPRVYGGSGMMGTNVTVSSMQPVVTGIDITYPAGVISGVVTWRGAPMENASVMFSGPMGGTSVTTGPDGTFVARGLDLGNWFWSVSRGSGTVVSGSVALSEMAPSVDLGTIVVPPGQIAGQVLDAAGAPTSASVAAVNTVTGQQFFAWANAGDFSIVGLALGSYRLRVTPMSGGDFTDPTIHTITESTPDITGVVVRFPATGSITGTVRRADGQVWASAMVQAFSGTTSRYGFADTNGVYTITGLLPGTYSVGVTSGMTTIYAPGTRVFANAATFNVVGNDVVVADITEPGPTVVRGRVTDSAGNGVAGVQVFPGQSFPFNPPLATTDFDGYYTITGALTPGVDYRLNFRKPGLLEAWYGGTSQQTAAVLRLTDGEQRNGVDVTMYAGAAVSGRVTNAAGEGVPSQMTLYPRGGVASAFGSNPDGTFTIPDVTPGTYVLLAAPQNFLPEAPSPYAPEWYGGGRTEATATEIVVTEGEVVTGMDIEVDLGARITGRVTRAADGAPVSGMTFSGRADGFPSWFGFYSYSGSRPDGTFEFVGLPGGSFTLQATPATETGLAESGPLPLSLTLGATTTQDVALQRGVIIDISILTATGPVPPQMGIGPGVCFAPAEYQIDFGGFSANCGGSAVPTIGLLDMTSGAYGPFRPGVAHTLRGYHFGLSQIGAAVTYTPLAGTRGSCTLVLPGAAGVSSCTQTPLAPSATIRGRVVAPNGTGLAGVEVRAMTATGTTIPTVTNTDDGGNYIMTDIPAGTYQLRFTPPGDSGLLTEWYSLTDAAYAPVEAQLLTVQGGDVLMDRSIRLDLGASTTGIAVWDQGVEITGGFAVGAAMCRQPAVYLGGFNCSDGTSLFTQDLSRVAPGTYQITPFSFFGPGAGMPTTLTLAAGDRFSCVLVIRVAATGPQSSTCTVTNTPPPSDEDGVPDQVEADAPNGGDGNGDGIQDSQQADVTSVGSTERGYLTLVVTSADPGDPQPTLADVTLETPPFDAPPLPANAQAESDLVGFEVRGLDPVTPQTVSVTVILSAPANQYWKYDAGTNTWIDATEIVAFGTQLVGSTTVPTATLTLVDGGPFDQDDVLGTITDPGVFAFGDEEPPTITCPSGAQLLNGRTVATVTDSGGSGLLGASERVLPTNVLGLGRSSTVVAVDAAGNQASTTCTYDVVVRAIGFGSPVTNTAINLVKAGQTVPLTWRTVDANGVAVADPATFRSAGLQTVNCTDGGPVAQVTDAAVSVGQGLQYLGNGVWQWNWKTSKTWSSGCRRFTVDLLALSDPTAVFAPR